MSESALAPVAEVPEEEEEEAAAAAPAPAVAAAEDDEPPPLAPLETAASAAEEEEEAPPPLRRRSSNKGSAKDAAAGGGSGSGDEIQPAPRSLSPSTSASKLDLTPDFGARRLGPFERILTVSAGRARARWWRRCHNPGQPAAAVGGIAAAPLLSKRDGCAPYVCTLSRSGCLHLSAGGSTSRRAHPANHPLCRQTTTALLQCCLSRSLSFCCPAKFEMPPSCMLMRKKSPSQPVPQDLFEQVDGGKGAKGTVDAKQFALVFQSPTLAALQLSLDEIKHLFNSADAALMSAKGRLSYRDYVPVVRSVCFGSGEWGLPEVRLENSPFPRPSPHPQALVEVFAKRPPTKERGCSEWIEIYSPKEGAIYLNKVQARGGSCLRAAAPADRRSARSLPPPLPFLCSTQRQGATTYEVPPDLQVAPDLMLSGLISYHRWAFCLCMADPLLTPALFFAGQTPSSAPCSGKTLRARACCRTRTSGRCCSVPTWACSFPRRPPTLSTRSALPYHSSRPHAHTSSLPLTLLPSRHTRPTRKEWLHMRKSPQPSSRRCRLCTPLFPHHIVRFCALSPHVPTCDSDLF